MAMPSGEVGGQDPSRNASLFWALALMEFAMREMLTMTKWCPVCGDAMGRVPTDGCSIVFRCLSCRTEIAKPAPRDNQRRRLSMRERRGGRIHA
jgi:tRNA(Ile2) C34 agmatinyltransferase TiaS